MMMYQVGNVSDIYASYDGGALPVTLTVCTDLLARDGFT